MQLKDVIETYNNLSLRERKDALIQIRENNDEDSLINASFGEYGRIATRMLADMGKGVGEIIEKRHNDIIALLNSKDPKIRINTAKIISNNLPEYYLDNIINALEKEDTMFVLPAYIKAIGAAKNEKAQIYLNSYKLKSTLEKHRREEKAALSRARENFFKRVKSNPRIIDSDVIFITAPNLYIAKREFNKNNISVKIADDYLITTHLKRYRDLFAVRAFTDAYIYLGSSEINKLPELIKKRGNAIFQRTGVRNYRLEITGVSHKDRVRLIKETKDLDDVLMNTPSSYSIELLADVKGSKARLFIDPLNDNRFSYRKESVPASIAGANAAAVCAFASKYFRPEASVLDNFCGSGTMLFERSFYEYGSLTGIDINLDAIKAAEINSTYAQSHPKFIHMDALKFNVKKFDEIITNMPFGLRVGNHSHNERLYKRYIEQLPSILTKDGIAILYTHEKKLLEKLLKTQPKLKLLEKAGFEAGGLNPAAYSLQNN